ncbi:MAG: dihydrolipoamide acetyltransferase family protein [Thermoplasmata archaeon]
MFEFKLPDIGEGVTEGEIVKWLVKSGDSIHKDQDMVEVMTDKVTVKIPSPVDGKVLEIKFDEGKVVKVGEAMIVVDDGKSEASSNFQAFEHAAPTVEVPAPPQPRKQEAVIEMKDEERRSISKVLASPGIRKLAKDLGVDLSAVKGTGPNGRVLEEDIKRYSVQRKSAAQSQAIQEEVSSPAKPSIPKQEVPPAAPPVQTADVIEPRGLRRLIFEKMTKAKQIMPHFTIIEIVDMTKIISVREDLKGQGITMGYTPFFVKASVLVLKEFPKFNSLYNESGRNYTQKHTFNIGVAVDTPDGLNVVVVKDADKKNLTSVSAEIASLAEKARQNKLSLAEVQGSTFTVSNVGSIAGIASTPIINYPEVAILGVHRMEKAIGADGKIYDRMFVSMSCDHRLIDGADAARFMGKLKEIIEKPAVLMV